MINKVKNSFLYKVLWQWPTLFYFSCIFISGTLISGFIIGQTQFPFFVYQMYSQPIPPTMVDSGRVSRIFINNHELNTFNLPKESGDIIRTNTDRFIFLKTNHFRDKYFDKLKTSYLGKYLPNFVYAKILTIPSVSDQQYAIWLIKYLQVLIKKPIRKVALYDVFYSYGNNNYPTVYQKKLVLTYPYE